MRILSLLALSLVGSAALFAFEKKPWFGDVYECQLTTWYTYSRYHHVQDAVHQLKHPSNDNLLGLDLGMTVSPSFDVALEAEFAHTPRMAWGLRSGAAQVRYLFLDDIAGDPVSWTMGLELRGATGHSLGDISSPYHAAFNAEIHSAVGKEWSKRGFWTYRTFGLMGIGMANRGSPWIRGLLSLEANVHNHHRFQLFSEGYFGFGRKREVNIHRFHGWGPIHHQSIDVGASYGYHFNVWGTLSLAYARRVYAHSFPQNVNFITLKYELPFSPF